MTTFNDLQEEIEISPGIYLSKPNKPVQQQPTKINLEDYNDHPEVLLHTALELKTSIKALHKTNQYLREYESQDQDCLDAIMENVPIMDRQMKHLELIMKQLKGVAPHLYQEVEDRFDGVEEDKKDEEGVFL